MHGEGKSSILLRSTNKMKPIQIRSCDGCTECCRGWLQIAIRGKEYDLGEPCDFVTDHGCKIYEDRPDHPCRAYMCAWTYDLGIPEWMKPSLSKVLCTTHRVENHVILELRECGQKMPVEVLNWAFNLFHSGKIKNLRYQIANEWYNLGPAFVG